MVFGLSNSVVSSLVSNATISSKVNLDKFRMTSAVPHPRDSSLEVVQAYKRAPARLDQLASASAAGLEGYFVGQMIAIGLNQIIGKDLTSALMQSSAYDIGIFHVGGFNQCMKHVYLMRLSTPPVSTEVLSFEGSCMYIPTVLIDFEVGSTRLGLMIRVIIGVFYTLAVNVLAVAYRPQQRILTLVSCGGGLLCFVFVCVIYPVPTDLTCGLQPWISGVAFVGLIGSMFARALCMARVARNAHKKKSRSQRLSEKDVLEVLVVVGVVFLCFLVVQTVVDPPRMKGVLTSNARRFEQCGTKSSVFKYVDKWFEGNRHVVGEFSLPTPAYVHSVRSFHRSKALAVCILNSTFLALSLTAIGLPMDDDNPTLEFANNTVILTLNTVFAVSVLHGLPVYRIFHHVNPQLSDSSFHRLHRSLDHELVLFRLFHIGE